jgi:hypothetical protein
MAKKNWQTIFLNELAETSNVKAAAEAAGVSQSCVYKTRRDEPDFARRWYEALAAGYDNLEMDLLCRLREGRLEDTDAEGNKRKFDIGTAFKCLAAHRETVARTKGRKTMEDELATMKAINAKIDKIRERQERAAELEARRARRARGE